MSEQCNTIAVYPALVIDDIIRYAARSPCPSANSIPFIVILRPLVVIRKQRNDTVIAQPIEVRIDVAVEHCGYSITAIDDHFKRPTPFLTGTNPYFTAGIL